MTDAVLIGAGVLFLLLGGAGCFLPFLPGPPLAYAGLLALHLTQRCELAGGVLAGGLALVVLVLAADWALPAKFTALCGGTRWGAWGCVLGGLAGMVGLFPVLPVGLVGGLFLGAVAGELAGGKSGRAALKAGVGAFLGFLAGTALKLAVCGVLAFWFIQALCAAE
ncbi:MAG: DUF456 domain-containing protein [Verrucomicrobiota bacterium]|jgi:uncharacterized protein YqgC (DUF456 family)|nr:DUF456 domain-containing protein [Verrucomicrobiota bacterium]